MFKTTGFLLIITGVTALLGALAQINPIWQFGPYDAARISYAVQPDWYMGFLDGALRIWPSWSFHSFGYTIPLEVTVPAVLFPGLVFNLIFAWPALERWYTKDGRAHNLLDRPSNRPKRTGAGVAVLASLSMLFIASSTDVIANFFHLSLNSVLWAMRVLCIIVPFIAYPITVRICREMQGVRGAGKRKTANVVTRTSEGEYVATPAPVYVDDRHDYVEPVAVPEVIYAEPTEVEDPGVRTVER